MLRLFQDFFIKDHFSNLPKNWRNLFKTVKLETFGNFLDFQQPVSAQQVWPLSLLSLRKMIQANCLPRQQQSKPFTANGFSINNKKPPTKTNYLDNERLQREFSRHVKPKKKYEIQQMSLQIAQLSAKTGTTFVIDIGSGLGHLCRILAYDYGLNVVGVEAQTDLKNRAETWDKKFETTAWKVCKDVKKYRPHHFLKRISFETTPDDFNQVRFNSFVQIFYLSFSQMVQEAGGSSHDYGIVGLHPCGNLAPILLKTFSENAEAKFLVLASCCYHRMFLYVFSFTRESD